MLACVLLPQHEMKSFQSCFRSCLAAPVRNQDHERATERPPGEPHAQLPGALDLGLGPWPCQGRGLRSAKLSGSDHHPPSTIHHTAACAGHHARDLRGLHEAPRVSWPHTGGCERFHEVSWCLATERMQCYRGAHCNLEPRFKKLLQGTQSGIILSSVMLRS